MSILELTSTQVFSDRKYVVSKLINVPKSGTENNTTHKKNSIQSKYTILKTMNDIFVNNYAVAKYIYQLMKSG